MKKKYEDSKEAKIQAEIDHYYQDMDAKQPGGPNPKKDTNWIRYDFTTGRRPYKLTTRGDIEYKPLEGKKFLKVHKSSCLFLPVPFLKNGGGHYINQYSISMEIMLDSLPASTQALFQATKYSDEQGEIWIRRDGSVGFGSHFAQNKSNSLKANNWALVTITVDCVSGILATYVDGLPMSEMKSEDLRRDGKYSAREQIALFGSRDAAEMVGGNIKWCMFETKVLSKADVKDLYDMIQEEGRWNCKQCTYRNHINATKCTLCGEPRVFEDEHKSQWICASCTCYNDASRDRCSVCETPAPALTRTTSESSTHEEPNDADRELAAAIAQSVANVRAGGTGGIQTQVDDGDESSSSYFGGL